MLHCCSCVLHAIPIARLLFGAGHHSVKMAFTVEVETSDTRFYRTDHDSTSRNNNFRNNITSSDRPKLNCKHVTSNKSNVSVFEFDDSSLTAFL